MNKFTLGVVAGMSSLALAVPALAQLTSAQDVAASSTSTASKPFTMMFKRGTPTQEDLQTMIDRDTAFLANIDAMVTLQKTAMQDRIDALKVAVTLTDEAAREEAVKAAHEEYRAAMDKAIEANPELREAMHMGMMMGKRMHMGPGPRGGDMLEKLGMTTEELKTAIESGKTIEDIAAEKGIELPEKMRMHKRMMFNEEAQENFQKETE